MAKKSAAATADQQDGNGAALSLFNQGEPDKLAMVLADAEIEDDGLGPVEEGDMKLRLMLFNLKGKTEDGKQLRQDVFVDSVTEEMTEEIECVWLVRERSNLWAEYDEKESKNIVKCSSDFSRTKGEMADGTIRPCQDCPDAKWRTDSDGKRTRNCSTVHWLVGIELKTGMPFALKFRRTSEPVIKQYLQRHHLGRCKLPNGELKNYPLFAFKSTARLEMHDSGNYALPILDCGDPITDKATILDLQAQAKTAREWLTASRRKFEDDDRDGGDTSFNPDDYGANAGQDVQV